MKNKQLYKAILTALFIALNFAGVYIQIKLPVGMVHLGNFVCIIGSFFLGGALGGTSASIGMALADLSMGYGWPSAIRTLILKFFMGFIAGSSFRIFIKNDKHSNLVNWIVTVILGILTIVFSILSPLSYQNKFSYSYIKAGSEKSGFITFHWIIPVLLAILFIMSLLVLIFRRKLNKASSAALSAASLGIAFNIFGEIFIKTLIYKWLNGAAYSTYNAAFIYSLTGLPSVIITSTITCVLVGFIFYPIYKGVLATNGAKYLGLYEIEPKNSEHETMENIYNSINNKEEDNK